MTLCIGFLFALPIAAVAYFLCLQFVFPGYFHPLTPHHNDFYFPPGLSFDGHSLLEKLTWPRPFGFIAFQILGNHVEQQRGLAESGVAVEDGNFAKGDAFLP